MATVQSAATGNFSAGATWVGGVKPQSGDTANINAGHTVTLDENFTGNITGSAATGSLTCGTSTRQIAGNVTYSGTSTSGLVIVPASATLTIAGQVSNTSSGRAIVTSGSGNITVSNIGGTALSNSGSGRGISTSGTGTMVIVGDVVNTGSGPAILQASTSTSHTITGSMSSGGSSSRSNSFGIQQQAGTVTFDGNAGHPNTSFGYELFANGGTINWSGSRTLAAGYDLGLYINSGTLNISNLSLACEGIATIIRTAAATVTATGATVTLQSASAAFTQLGTNLGANYSVAVIGPTLPSVANVWYGSGQYGYAGGLLSPTKRASNITNCTSPNIKALTVIDDVSGTYTGGQH
jgi:hypothetical protein